MANYGYRQVFIDKTDNELLDIIHNKHKNYQKNAILDIAAILTERGVPFTMPFDETIEFRETIEAPLDYSIYSPMIIGILLVAFAIIDPFVPSHGALFINITINVIIRVIVIFWSLNLCEKYKLNKVIWGLLGLLFGGWALIAINIAVWTKVPAKEDPSGSEII